MALQMRVWIVKVKGNQIVVHLTEDKLKELCEPVWLEFTCRAETRAIKDKFKWAIQIRLHHL